MQKQKIPFFSLKKQTNAIEDDMLVQFQKVLGSQQFIGGSEVAAFEKKFADYLNIPHVISCNSGTDALWLALKALNLPNDALVLTTPFSFIASSTEIVSLKSHPVFIDVDQETFNISPQNLKHWLESHAAMKNQQAIHRKTQLPIVGILAVDLFGQCAEYRLIKEIAEEWNLWIIEDAAQAVGSHCGEKKAGTFGTISTFSFYPTKNLGAFGDAGCCVTDDPHLAERILRLKNHGRKTHYEYEEMGINSRLDSLQAVCLSYKLDLVDTFNKKRYAHAQHYQKCLRDLSIITLPEQLIGTHVYHQYCIQVAPVEGQNLRDELKSYLEQHGIGTNIFYPKVFTQIPFLNTHEALKQHCPVAEKLSETILALPIWPELEVGQIEYLCDVIKNFSLSYEKKKRSSQSKAPTQQTALF